MAVSEAKPSRDPHGKAEGIAYEYELRARALREFPEIAGLGNPGDKAFESAIDAAISLITGSAVYELDDDLNELDDDLDDPADPDDL
jgi:hypothetical protein